MSVKGEFYHSLAVDPEVCVGCAHCIRKCSTKALRIRGGKAAIRKNWCVDCGECLKTCPVGAIYVEQDDFGRIFDYAYRVVLFPAAFLGQFPETDSEGDIYAALRVLGFTHVRPVELTADLLREQMAAEIASCRKKPLISPFCPAIVRLIQTKFPDLVDHIMNLRTPVETTAVLVRKQLLDEGCAAADIGIFYMTPCAAKAASMREEDAGLVEGILNLDSLYNKVCHILHHKKGFVPVEIFDSVPIVSQSDMKWSMTSGEASGFGGRCFAVDGISNVIDFIERLETTGELHGIDFLELRACNRSCVGGSLTPANRFLAGERLRNRTQTHPLCTGDPASAEEIRYVKERLWVEKRPLMTKLLYQGGIQEVLRSMDSARKIQELLPGIDCGACGSPTCKSLSQDIVRHEAVFTNCIFMQLLDDEDRRGSGNTLHRLEEVWGVERFKKKH